MIFFPLYLKILFVDSTLNINYIKKTHLQVFCSLVSRICERFWSVQLRQGLRRVLVVLSLGRFTGTLRAAGWAPLLSFLGLFW